MFSRFDPFQAAWLLDCPQAQRRASVGLDAFRRLARLAGPRTPPVWRVRYRCVLCAEQHEALMSGTELDLDPVYALAGAHLDLCSGQLDWQAGPPQWWSERLAAGHWPVNLWCGRERRAVGGWPSLLVALEPDHEPHPHLLLAHYRCPCCERPETLQLSTRQLSLAALPPTT